jgi:hypothetical protein
MYRAQHARTAMMIKTVNMARSFDEPKGHEPSPAVFPGFCYEAYAETMKLAILF